MEQDRGLVESVQHAIGSNILSPIAVSKQKIFLDRCNMEEVIQQLVAEGFQPNGILPDGNLYRFPDGPDDKRNSGWAKVYENYLATDGTRYYFAVYGSWRAGEPKKFCTLGKRLPREQAAIHKEQLRRAKEEAERKREEGYREVAEEAAVFFNSCAQSGSSEYLRRKGIKHLAVLAIRYGLEHSSHRGSIFVPCRDVNDRLWSFEQIFPDGKKWSYAGGRKAGCFHGIGSVADSSVLYLAEGFATAASIYLATGSAALCCFGSGQFENIAKALRAKYPTKKLVVCGDLDKPGREGAAEKAEKAAKSVGAALVFPRFVERGENKDFNDLHQAEGLEAVKEQLSEGNALEPVKQSISDPFPHEDDRGNRLGTYTNFKELCRRLGIVIRYNGISKKEEVNIPNLTATLDNEANVKLAHLASYCVQARIPKGDLAGYVTALADENCYNPVAMWIESEPWDGQSRLHDLYDTLTSSNKELKELLMRLWLISAIAAVYEPDGVSAHGVLVLQGVQYSGKTNWFRSLCQEQFRLDGVTLQPADKDSVATVVSYWLAELGELDSTFKKSEISQLKSFFPKKKDQFRRPYARVDSQYPRRTVFIGSVNDPIYLNDPTGNRRFWTIDCSAIEPDHGIDMQQLWAEVRELYRSGAQWMLTRQELALLNEHNAQFEAVDPIEELIQQRFPWEARPERLQHTWMSSLEILKEMGERTGKAECNQVARVLLKRQVKRDARRRFLMPVYKDVRLPGD